MTKEKLPSISELFKTAWNLFKTNILNLFLLFLITVLTLGAVVTVFALVIVVLGVGSVLSNPQAGILALLGNPALLLVLFIIALIGIGILIFLGTLFQIANMRLIYEDDKKTSITNLIRTSTPFVLPMIGVSLLMGFFILGGYGIFFIPGIIIAILLSFSTYEVIFNNQRGLNALRRSLALFLTNFWGILGRLAIFVVLTMLVTVIIPKDDGYGVLGALVNIIIGWFGLCYSITLYKQINKGNSNLPGRSLMPLTIIAVIGYLIIAGLVFIGLNAAKDALLMNQTNSQMEYNQMPTDEELNKLLEDLPNDVEMMEDQSI